MLSKFRQTLGLLALTVALAVSARTVKDIEGKPVELPEQVNRIVNLWPANNQVVLLLGAAPKLVGTTDFINKNPWYRLVYPPIKDVPVMTDGETLNSEELLASKPDVVLLSNKNLLADVEKAGLKGVLVKFQDFEGLKKTVRITAEVIGGKAPQIAEEYVKELEANMALVQERVKDIPEDKKPTVLHITGGDNLLKIDGGQSMIGSWVVLAGGKNALPEAKNMVTVSLEEIIHVNPQVIIIGSSGNKSFEAIKKIKDSPEWASIDAVKNHRVYANPMGTFPWDRYSTEEALQILWAAQLFHPEKFKDIDLVAKTQAFYKKYYNFELSADQAQRIISGDKPAE